MELKDIQGIVDNGFKDLEAKVDAKFQSQFDNSKKSIVSEIEAKGYKSEEDINKLIESKTADLEAAVLDLKKAGLTPKKESGKSFEERLAEGLVGSKDALTRMKNGSKGGVEAMLFKANEDLDPANFSGDSYELATTDRSRGLYQSPFMPLWFRTLMPQGSTTGGTIQYIKENGNVGAAAVWDGTGAITDLEAKPGTAPLFDDVTENVFWIAGITRVKREMLDDISWLQGYLARRLTVGRTGLWVAENTQIYNKLVANSVVYDGVKTNPIEILVDAAFGQLRDYYYNPSVILMNNRDVTNLITLNQASTSGLYNLPNGVVAIVNGRLTIGGIPVTSAPNVPQGEYLIMDSSATEFVNRMSPEVRFFEQDRDNVTKNLITVRAEERILPMVYDENAIIAGSFVTTT